MKNQLKYFAFLILILVSTRGISQKNFVVSNLPTSTQNDLNEWNRVVNKMQGINAVDPVGGDVIYSYPAEKSEWGSFLGQINNWRPLSSQKQTLCGILDRFNTYDGDGAEMDWNNFIIPNDEFSFLITDALPFKGGDGFWCVEDNWQHCGDNRTIPCVEAEITPDESFYENPYFPKSIGESYLEGREICVYGPWVRECVHGHRPEIHPSEMVWWQDDDKNYYMMLVQDDSNRFDESDKFDTDGSAPSDWKPWAQPPLTAQFKIAFKIPRSEYTGFIVGRKPQKMDIHVLHNRFVVTEEDSEARADCDDGKSHTLVYNNRAILTINELQENDSDLGVKFVDISQRADGTIQGYVQITTKVGGPNIRGEEGYHVLYVNPTKFSSLFPIPEKVGNEEVFIAKEPSKDRPKAPNAVGSKKSLKDRPKALKNEGIAMEPKESSSKKPSAPKSKETITNLSQSERINQQWDLKSIKMVEINGANVLVGDMNIRNVTGVKLLKTDRVPGTSTRKMKANEFQINNLPIFAKNEFNISTPTKDAVTIENDGYGIISSPIKVDYSGFKKDNNSWNKMLSFLTGKQFDTPNNFGIFENCEIVFSPIYSPLKNGKPYPEENSRLATFLNKNIIRINDEGNKSMSKENEPFVFKWNFSAKNLLTKKPIKTSTSKKKSGSALQIQFESINFLNDGIQVSFPNDNNIYELKINLEIIDVFGNKSKKEYTIWSHYLKVENNHNSIEELLKFSSDIRKSLENNSSLNNNSNSRLLDLLRTFLADAIKDEMLTINEIRSIVKVCKNFSE